MAYIEEANELMTDATGQSIATAIGNMSATSVGNLAALQTTDKTSLVGAVNEVKRGLINLHGYTDISVSILDPSLSFTATENCILWLRTSNSENITPYFNYLVNNTLYGLKGGSGATLDNYVFLRAGDVFRFNDSYPYESALTNYVFLV